MKRTFKGALLTLGAIFLTASFLFGIIVVTPEETALFNFAMSLMVMGLCSSPLVMLVAVVSGIATLVDNLQNRSKRKRGFDHLPVMESDEQLDEIMRRLTPEQQAYLEQRLQNSRLGVGTDGELVSMNELLDEFDDFDQMSKRG